MTEAEILALIQEKKALGNDPTKVEITDLAKVLKSFQDAIFGEGGGVGTLNQVLNTGDTTDQEINFDISLTAPTTEGQAVSKTWMSFAPLVKTGLTNAYAPSTFFVRQNATKQGATINEVMHFGWNMGTGGGPANESIPAIGESWESNYSPDGQRWVEKHEFYLTPTYFSNPYPQIRLSSYTINTVTGTIDYYMTVGRWSVKVPYSEGGRVYSALQPGSNGGKWYVGYNEVSNVGFEYGKDTGVSLYGSGFDSNANVLTLQGFRTFQMPGLTTAQIEGGVNIKIYGTTDAIIDLQTHNICDIGHEGRRFKTAFIQQQAIRTKAGDLTTSDLPSNTYQVSKNTSSGAVKLYVNDGGTIKSITLT
jgi:hypothetical protein